MTAKDAMHSDLIIIGGGASGLMAAGIAAARGRMVIILEKMSRPARKLSITGKGRCNITNIASPAEFMKHIGPDSRFLKFAFSKFFAQDLITFFNGIGVQTVTEQGGRVFPASEKAQDVVDALVNWATKSGVEIRCDQPVKHIALRGQEVAGVIMEDSSLLKAGSVILASGGSSYPATGSTGDGYKMAKELSHTVSAVRPALVPFETEGDLAQRMQGLALKNVQVNVWIDGRKAGEAFGEMLFTHFGVSGPIILSLSRRFADDVMEGKHVDFSIDLKPALDDAKLDARLLRDINEHGKKSYASLLKMWLPSSMIPVFAVMTAIHPEKLAHQISAAERKKIRLLMKDLRLKVRRTRGFKEAIITAGGVSTKEIDPTTMQSKRIKNLYFAGEVIDLDADTGGYNLQIAFSTGFVAGSNA
jgi:predicted Rossmann fold flavoprotein